MQDYVDLCLMKLSQSITLNQIKRILVVIIQIFFLILNFNMRISLHLLSAVTFDLFYLFMYRLAFELLGLLRDDMQQSSPAKLTWWSPECPVRYYTFSDT